MESKVYYARDVQKALGLGKTKTYEFLNEVYERKSPFIVIKVGKAVRVLKGPFDKWINGEV